MKISKIKLNSYLHFKPGLEINLTYPLGHPKEGKPLEKVCFLGQSATGKTTLLNLIKCCVCPNGDFNQTGIDKSAFIKDGIELFFTIDNKHISKVSVGDFNFEHYDYADPQHPKRIDYVKPFQETIEYLIEKQCKPLLISFPFCVVIPEGKQAESTKFNPIAGEMEPTLTPGRQVWDFDHTAINSIWDIVFEQVQRYLKEHRTNQVKSFTQISAKPGEAATIVQEFQAWEKSHPNPIKELADKCLTRILDHFHLEIETNLDQYQGELPSAVGKMHVIIKHKTTGQEVPYDFLRACFENGKGSILSKLLMLYNIGCMP